MSLLSRKTLALLALALLLGLANLLPAGGSSVAEALPVLPAVDREQVTRVEIRHGQLDKVVIEGSLEAGWEVVEPYASRADAILMRTVVSLFADPVPMEVRVDEGDAETYGVDDNEGVLVELFTSGEEPALSVVVGADMPGGTSFVRLQGSDTVYRARVGGRNRYIRDPLEWRDHLLLTSPVEQVSDVEIRRGGFSTHLQRLPTGALDRGGAPKLGPWTLPDQPGFRPDQQTLTELAGALSTVRAGRILSAGTDGGFEPPVAEVTLRLSDGGVHTLTFGSRPAQGAVFMKLSGRDDVFLVSASKLAAVPDSLDALRDLTVFSLRREDIATLRLEDGGVPVELTQLDDGLWSVTEPANVDADVKEILFTANTLASLRAAAIDDAVTPEQAGLLTPTTRVTFRMKSGETLTLELGRDVADERGRMQRYARRSGRPEIFRLDLATVVRIRKGFGRAD